MMPIISATLVCVWVGISSLAMVGGVYLMRCPPPEWDHFVRLGRFGRATIRRIGQIDQILDQLGRQDNGQDDQQED